MPETSVNESDEEGDFSQSLLLPGSKTKLLLKKDYFLRVDGLSHPTSGFLCSGDVWKKFPVPVEKKRTLS